MTFRHPPPRPRAGGLAFGPDGLPPFHVRVGQSALRSYGRIVARREFGLRVAGREHVPARGPVVVAARHVHHLHDGCALMAALPRRLHIVVGLDWVDTPGRRRLMELACRLAGWPILLREERLDRRSPDPDRSAYRLEEARRYLRRAAEEAVAILSAGRIMVVFPEGYPNVDPVYTPKHGPDDWLPFRPGFAQFAELAERAGSAPVPIIPAGLHYDRGQSPRVTLRFGPPTYRRDWGTRRALIDHVEAAVHRLSAPASPDRRTGAPRAYPIAAK